MKSSRIETDRLILRRWCPPGKEESDLDALASLNSDPRVMEHFPALVDRERSAKMIERCEASFERAGYAAWACELKETGKVIGFVGLLDTSWSAPFTPCVEILWRLAYEHWGKGLAPEGARAALRFGFEVAGLPEIVSFTAVGNLNSRRVMEKIGMARDPGGDFEHPLLPAGHRLRPHVLYRIKKNPRGP